MSKYYASLVEEFDGNQYPWDTKMDAIQHLFDGHELKIGDIYYIFSLDDPNYVETCIVFNKSF